jgi:hypothetical protein
VFLFASRIFELKRSASLPRNIGVSFTFDAILFSRQGYVLPE